MSSTISVPTAALMPSATMRRTGRGSFASGTTTLARTSSIRSTSSGRVAPVKVWAARADANETSCLSRRRRTASRTARSPWVRESSSTPRQASEYARSTQASTSRCLRIASAKSDVSETSLASQRTSRTPASARPTRTLVAMDGQCVLLDSIQRDLDRGKRVRVSQRGVG